jgi:polyribonucleotide nucleotidyltransferase
VSIAIPGFSRPHAKHRATSPADTVQQQRKQLVGAAQYIARQDRRIADLEAQLADIEPKAAERDAAVAELQRLQQRAIRDAADKERLRQAVINARPRITAVDTQLVRPFAPEVVLPYVSPVPYRDNSSEMTQELPLIYVPRPREA